MVPSPSRLPSLDLLRGFVAVGRRMSITEAAADLHVTQSAVSKQVRTLEQALGVALLRRGHRSLAFTAEGERLYRVAQAALAQLQAALRELQGGDDAAPVTVTTTIGVAGVWLLPRLSRLRAALPDVDVRVAASTRLAALADEGIDLAIRYAETAGDSPATRLFDELVAPVAAPALAAGGFPATDALARQTLLELDEPHRPGLQWAPWLAARGLRLEDAGGVLRFNHYDQLIRAAADGQGLALGRLGLIVDALRGQQLALVEPQRPALHTGRAYWLVAGSAPLRAAAARVHDWVLAEAAEVREQLARWTPAAPADGG